MTTRKIIPVIAVLMLTSAIFAVSYSIRARNVRFRQETEEKAVYFRTLLTRTQSMKVFSINGPEVQIAYLVPDDQRFGQVMDEFKKCLAQGRISSPKGPHLSGPFRFKLELVGQETLEIVIKINAIQFGDDFFSYNDHMVLGDLFLDELMQAAK